MSRITDIEEMELEEREEVRDDIFSQLSDTLLSEKRLLKRFFEFCEQYNNFEYDEMGINMEESEMVLKRVIKIRDLLLLNIENKLSYSFDNVDTEVLTKCMTMEVVRDEIKYKIIIQVMPDSFHLELV